MVSGSMEAPMTVSEMEIIDTKFGPPIYNADLMITFWEGIGMDFLDKPLFQKEFLDNKYAIVRAISTMTVIAHARLCEVFSRDKE